MKKQFLGLAFAAITLPTVALALNETEPPPPPPSESLSPNEIVAGAPANEWVVIDEEDLLVMTLAPDRDGNERKVVIQLMPAPFSQGWVENIRTLARAEWYDGISVNRVQDNYVVQWGDPGHDNPEGEGIETKPLPEGLNVMDEGDYTSTNADLTVAVFGSLTGVDLRTLTEEEQLALFDEADLEKIRSSKDIAEKAIGQDAYSRKALHSMGWALAQSAGDIDSQVWPVHCYGMVGVGRNFSPDTGSGAELYTVVGHAPRHLDRNIALAGRIIDGMEHLSSLPRGSGVLGFYTEEEADLRTPILSIRVASDLPEDERPQFEYLSTEGETFANYAEARANRRDPFFIVPAGGADICNIPVPIRAVNSEGGE